uniref:Anoctamin n=1 Tax=Ascaris lumbricoides TaxID=6252 RepID=A0A0M3IJV3_ASCLU
LWKSHFVFQVYHKLFTVFVLCDAYKKWIERRATCTTDKLYDLEWRFYECLLQSATEMFAFFAVILVTAGSIKSGVHLRRILEATCAGYFEFRTTPSTVFGPPRDPIYPSPPSYQPGPLGVPVLRNQRNHIFATQNRHAVIIATVLEA